MQRITNLTVLSTIVRIVKRTTTAMGVHAPGEEPTVATDLHDVTCVNCRETFVIDEDAFIDGIDQDGTWMCEGCWNAPPASYLAEIEDGPYDPSQDCCPCDWDQPCDLHPTTNQEDTATMKITRDPLFTYMIAEARLTNAMLRHDLNRAEDKLWVALRIHSA